MDENEISTIIIASAIEAHRQLGGPGLLESVYEEALVFELLERGLIVERQKDVPIIYKNHHLGSPLRLDMVVNGLVVVECKAAIELNPIFEAQLLTYLRLSGLKLGLLINFGQRLVKHGVHRVVNGLGEPITHTLR